MLIIFFHQITKKLAGDVREGATWMTNVTNEYGQVLNCVLTTGEGPAIDELCQGIVKRYQDANEPEPEVIYVDRDCCNEAGMGLFLLSAPLFYTFKNDPLDKVLHCKRVKFRVNE